MQYTLWSRGRLLGTTDFGFVYRNNGLRFGWLYPTLLGERLLPAACGVAPAFRTQFILGDDPTLRADLQAAIDQEEALELEVRGPDGSVIRTEDIGITDTHYLLSIPHNDDLDDVVLSPEEAAEVEAMVQEVRTEEEEHRFADSLEPEVEHPRYQIQICLVGHNDVPEY
jgi:hypothetical protein